MHTSYYYYQLLRVILTMQSKEFILKAYYNHHFNSSSNDPKKLYCRLFKKKKLKLLSRQIMIILHNCFKKISTLPSFNRDQLLKTKNIITLQCFFVHFFFFFVCTSSRKSANILFSLLAFSSLLYIARARFSSAL